MGQMAWFVFMTTPCFALSFDRVLLWRYDDWDRFSPPPFSSHRQSSQRAVVSRDPVQQAIAWVLFWHHTEGGSRHSSRPCLRVDANLSFRGWRVLVENGHRFASSMNRCASSKEMLILRFSTIEDLHWSIWSNVLIISIYHNRSKATTDLCELPGHWRWQATSSSQRQGGSPEHGLMRLFCNAPFAR